MWLKGAMFWTSINEWQLSASAGWLKYVHHFVLKQIFQWDLHLDYELYFRMEWISDHCVLCLIFFRCEIRFLLQNVSSREIWAIQNSLFEWSDHFILWLARSLSIHSFLDRWNDVFYCPLNGSGINLVNV